MNAADDTVTIEFSKGKIFIRLMGCLAFVVLGIFMWHNADIQSRYPSLYVKILSVLTISFFGIGLILLPYKMFSKDTGLVLDNYGINFNNGANKTPLTIAWRNIIGFEIKKIKSTKILLIFINNAEEIINAEGSTWKQKLMGMTLKMYGTPLSISTGTYKCSFDDLVKIMSSMWQKHRVK